MGAGNWAARCPASFSLSLFSSQELKFNYISKEINFNVTFYARVKCVTCKACAACDVVCGSGWTFWPLLPIL